MRHSPLHTAKRVALSVHGHIRGRGQCPRAARGCTLAGDGDIGNPIISQVVTATIAYADVLTAAYGERINQRDHRAAIKNLRDSLGKRLPAAQANRLTRILGEKDAAQYGPRPKSKEEAMRLLTHLEAFAAWAEAELRRPR